MNYNDETLMMPWELSEDVHSQHVYQSLKLYKGLNNAQIKTIFVCWSYAAVSCIYFQMQYSHFELLLSCVVSIFLQGVSFIEFDVTNKC